MHMSLLLDENCGTAATDGKCIWFSPRFLNTINNRELEFVMMHEILHVVLQHCLRGVGLYAEQFNIACDIVVNSNILLSQAMDPASISLRNYFTRSTEFLLSTKWKFQIFHHFLLMHFCEKS